ncbi:ribosome-inactivating family protein [Streptomyces caniscabiei]|uniref:ribosome-inactivating family protein n=1 Tax=Streptomyces caniscabiei TaxID=2746961 RepID=UPI0029BD72B5|nr:ribosome-inactivating family protein [Streptomyces caniscabiei]MDX2600794.1 ribosome-inactivating family protein [Streptomyces caniscabiei]MDX2736625.1 ribosome-inactivating family protein [Streptomyces caniscabiei]MDX2777254.1 ribosome-inactivating family protein [Streptomyces caniscabiei]
MPTSVAVVIALSVLLGFLVIIEAWMNTLDFDFPEVRWQLSRSSGAYLHMLDQLQNLAESSAKGNAMPDANIRRKAHGTDESDIRDFADVVISSDNHSPTVHAIVRLSDFRVVRFFVRGTPHDFVLNLASGIPKKKDATDDNWFVGKDGYDDLARIANQSLTDVDLSRFSLEQSLRDLGVRDTDRTAQASAMLRYSIAITAASRFRPVADHIAGGMDKGSHVFVTAQQVDLIRG